VVVGLEKKALLSVKNAAAGQGDYRMMFSVR
jgi:hypothetical protein